MVRETREFNKKKKKKKEKMNNSENDYFLLDTFPMVKMKPFFARDTLQRYISVHVTRFPNDV